MCQFLDCIEFFYYLYVFSLVQLDTIDFMPDTAQGWDEDGLHFCN